MAVPRDGQGDIQIDCQVYYVVFFYRRQTTPKSEDEQEKYNMVSDEMNKMKPTIFKKQRPGLESRKRFEKYIFMGRSLINKLEKKTRNGKHLVLSI